MGKIWGYDRNPGAMLAKQVVGRGRNRRKVLMKLPSVFDMQRLVLSKHLSGMCHSPLVYSAKMTDPKFDEKLEAFTKNEILPYHNKSRRFHRKFSRKLRKDRLVPLEQSHSNDPSGDAELDSLFYTTLKDDLTIYRRKLSPEEKTEFEWNQSHWRTPFLRDQVSKGMNEVFSMNRMVSQSYQSFSAIQHVHTICLESARYALKEHDWSKMALSVCGILDSKMKVKFDRHHHGSLTAIWMYGMLALANHYRHDVQVLRQYASYLKKAVFAVPVWIEIQLAAWLIQKGYFLDAFASLEELCSGSYIGRSTRIALSTRNWKRYQAFFIIDMIKAVKLYSEWKRELNLLLENEQFLDDDEPLRDSIRRKGEATLTAYEELYIQHKILKCDVMSLLQPLLELIIEYRSVERAVQILHEVYIDNDGNLAVEEFVIQKLESYAQVCDISSDYFFQIKDRWQKKVAQTEPKDLLLRHLRAKRKIENMRFVKKKSCTVAKFIEIDNAVFSY